MKERWVNDITAWDDDALVAELDHLERAVARGIVVNRRAAGPSGRGQVRLGADLLALAEREHAVLRELRRRHHATSAAHAA